MTIPDISFLTELENIIQQRLSEGAEESYTAQLVASGDKRVAQKVGEEAVELALATVAGDREEQIEEAADLVFHLLVLLQARELSLAEVSAVLKQRHTAN